MWLHNSHKASYRDRTGKIKKMHPIRKPKKKKKTKR